MSEPGDNTRADEVPARLLAYESRALTYRSDRRKLVRALLLTTLVCGSLAVLSFLVGERQVVNWAHSNAGEDTFTHDVQTFFLRAPRFVMYAVFGLFFIIGLDRKQRFWVHVALVVLVLELVAAGAVVRILKIVIGRARPYMEANDFRPLLLTWNSYHSFPSGDAADIAVSVSFFLYFARRNKLRLAAVVVIALIAFERLMNKHHYPSDVLAGTYIGLVSSFVMWHWFAVGFPIRAVRRWLGQDEPAPHAAQTEGSEP